MCIAVLKLAVGVVEVDTPIEWSEGVCTAVAGDGPVWRRAGGELDGPFSRADRPL